MKENRLHRLMIAIASTLLLTLLIGCSNVAKQPPSAKSNLLQKYVATPDSSYKYDFYKKIVGDGYTTHILRMVSGQWLTKQDVRNPEWWHWVRIVVPDSVGSTIGMLFIGGGDRDPDEPKDANKMLRALATQTGSIVTHVHNVPNQPTVFIGDDYGEREEDELIAYGWRQFLEKGAGDEHAEWLARLPMTRAAVRAMDTATDYVDKTLGKTLDRYVVAGGSKRGWTTWTTAIADKRVIAIAPIVIDMLNLVPSFQHHWRAYGEWSPAVNDYVHEGIMEWMGSLEFNRLLDIVEPYSFREQLTLPKMMIDASSDEFFLPDSWQFYWNDLVGEKHIRYVPNSGHSLDKTDAVETLIAFHHSIITDTPRPEFDWTVDDGTIHIKVDPKLLPTKVTLWQAINETARNFRFDVVKKIWTSESIPLSSNGVYNISVETPEKGWRAFFVELTFPGPGDVPFKQTTGIVVVPETLPYPDFVANPPRGTQPLGS